MNIISVANSDFIPILMQLVFDETVTEHCVKIPIIDDFTLEDTESFDVTLSSPDADVTFPFPTASVTILDNDMVGVGLEETEYDVSEGDGTVEICAVVTIGSIQRRLMVSLTTANLSAGNVWTPLACTYKLETI